MKSRWTLYRKIQLIIIVVLIFVFIASQIAISQILSKELRDNFKDSVKATAQLLQSSIEVVFSDAQNSLEFIKGQYEGNVRDDAFIREYLNLMTESKEYIKNAFITYTDGSFVLEPDATIPDDFDPRNRLWYKLAFNTKAESISWSSPYTDKASGVMVITASEYIKLAESEGVIGVDIEVANIPDILGTVSISDNGFIVLINDEGDIIAAEKKSLLGEKITVFEDDEFSDANMISGSLSTDKGLYILKPVDKEKKIRLVAYSPHEDIVLSTQSLQVISLIIMIIASSVGVLISYFLSKRLTRPIESLTATMAESVNANTLIEFDEQTNDEIDTLIQSYNSLVANFNHKNSALVAVSNELKKSESKLQEQYDIVREQAYTDYLTGLPNRISFEQKVRVMIGDDIQFALFYIDLDNFKYINDTYGHNYGDFVLQIISNRFKNCCEGKYFGARLSGDEFGVIVPFEQVELLDEIAIKILEMLRDPIHYDEMEFSLTGSIGIAMYPEDGKSFEDLLSNADIAMYEAKNKSKNLYLIFDKPLRSALIKRVKIETNLVNALEQEEIYVTYQPLIDFQTKSVNGFEALLRWNSKELGPIPPNEFIPVAEYNLYINKLGAFVLEQAVKFGKELFETFGRYYEMNVNVSLIQLHLEHIVDDVLGILDQYDYPAKYLNLEITESVALESDKKIHSKLKALRASGVQLSLDDFGTGYSSLNQLLNIPLTHLKIDRMIIIKATKEKEVYRLIQGIVEFAHAIGIRVVAEGIEDSHMEGLMEKMSIDFAQGYLYSKPIFDKQILNFLKEVDSL